MIELIINLLHGPGDFLRNLSLAVPLWMGRGLFILYPFLLIVWVWRMRPEEVKGDLPGAKRNVDLRPYVAFSMAGQMLIYLIF